MNYDKNKLMSVFFKKQEKPNINSINSLSNSNCTNISYSGHMPLFWSQGQIPFYQKYFIQSCGHKSRGAPF